MPLFVPVLLGIGVVSAISWAAKKLRDGAGDIQDSKQIAQRAQERSERNRGGLDRARESVNVAANEFGTFKLEVARETVGGMVRLLEDLQRRGRMTSFESLHSVELEPAMFIAEMPAHCASCRRSRTRTTRSSSGSSA
jgi:hypothetical protein